MNRQYARWSIPTLAIIAAIFFSIGQKFLAVAFLIALVVILWRAYSKPR